MNDFIIDNALESYNNNFNRLDSFDFIQNCTVQLALESYSRVVVHVQVLTRAAPSNKPDGCTVVKDVSRIGYPFWSVKR